MTEARRNPFLSTDKITPPENTLTGHKIFVGKPNVKRPLGIPKIRWDNNIKMDLEDTGYEAVDRIFMD
jgi:hypothetical protein